MHELSIAMSMVEMATEEAARQGDVQVTALHLRLGQFSGVVKEALMFSWEVACEGTPVAGAQLLIEETAIVVYCSACQKERIIDSIQKLFCPVCHTPTSDVRQGKELEVIALEIQ